MSNSGGRILSVEPPRAIPGGEVIIELEGFKPDPFGDNTCLIDGLPATITGISKRRLVAVVPEDAAGPLAAIELTAGEDALEGAEITIGTRLADDMHIVANPAVDPADDSIILTQSGSRGQQMPVTLFRLETDGYVHEMSANILNPTGLAFDEDGDLYVTNRAEGEVARINRDEEVVNIIGGLGVATGIAFDSENTMYVGDRSGTIYRLPAFGKAETYAVLEPSVAAYHLAFGPDGRLYVSAPGLASYDSVYVIDPDGTRASFFRGLGRPQGLAFDTDGNLYIAACYRGSHGIVKISPDGSEAETFVAGMNLVGLCFTRDGDMVVATNDAVYSLALDIQGTLLK